MCQWCDENNVPCSQVFLRMTDFVNHIHNTHMVSDSSEYTCMWKDCSRKLAKKVAFKGMDSNILNKLFDSLVRFIQH